MQQLKRLFVRGLLALIPLVATIYVLDFIFDSTAKTSV
jgi:uncharacterized membrane protein